MGHNLAYIVNRQPLIERDSRLRALRLSLIVYAMFSIVGVHAEPLPNARLSPTSDPVISTDAIGFQMLHYTDGRGVDLRLSLAGLPVGAYDVFQRNNALMSAPFNIARSRVDYVGSFAVTIAGQLTVQYGPCSDCRWELYNAYNKVTVIVTAITQERDFTYCPTSIQPFNNNTANKASVFTGLPETVKARYLQRGFVDTLPFRGIAQPYGFLNGIGWNSSSSISGVWGGGTHDDANYAAGVQLLGEYIATNVVGLNRAYMMVSAADNSNQCGFGGAPPSILYSAHAPSDGLTADDQGHMTLEWQD
jgi:hypothetical protein